MVEGRIEEAFHHVGDRQGDAAAIAAPFELIHEPAADGVQIGHQVADDQVQGQRLVELLFAAGLAEVESFADVPIDPAAESGGLLFVVGALVEHVGQEFHVQPGDFQAERLPRRYDVRHRGLHAHRVVAEDDDAAAFQSGAGHGGICPIHQRRGGRVGRLGIGAGVGPGADVEVCQPAALGQGAVDGMGIDHARLRSAVTAGDVQRHVGRQVGQQADERELGEGPGVRGADHGIDARLAELPADDVGLRFTVDQDRRPNDVDRFAVGRADLGGEQLGDGLDDIARALPRGLVDAWIAGADDAEGDGFRLGLGADQFSGSCHDFLVEGQDFFASPGNRRL